MSQARVISRPRPSARGKVKAESGGKKKWVVLALLFLLLLGLGAWAMSGPDPGVAKIQALRAEIDNASGDQRRALWGQMREEMEKLPEAAREQLFAERRQEWETRENKRMTEFFAMPRDQQIAAIDKQIDDWEKRRKERAQRQQNGAQANGQGGRGGPGGGFGPGGGGGRGGGGGAGRSTDPSAALQRGKNYLDRSSPESRAQRGEYRRMVQDRRQQRGLQ
jgi:uncharacterized membrane protein YgcG